MNQLLWSEYLVSDQQEDVKMPEKYKSQIMTIWAMSVISGCFSDQLWSSSSFNHSVDYCHITRHWSIFKIAILYIFNQNFFEKKGTKETLKLRNKFQYGNCSFFSNHIFTSIQSLVYWPLSPGIMHLKLNWLLFSSHIHCQCC